MISFIVPVYNMEKYLRQCIDSLLVISDVKKEIILINDGSEDQSYNICLEYSEKYNEVRAFTQKNQGVSVARNKGIDLAVGKYIAFIDADDFVSTTYNDQLFRAFKFDVDCYIFNYTRWLSSTNQNVGHWSMDDGIYSHCTNWTRQIAGLEVSAIGIAGFVYKKSIIENNKLKFRIGMKTNEDFDFNIRYLKCIKNYYSSSDAGYCYRLNPTSTTAKRALTHANDYEYMYFAAKDFLKELNASESDFTLYEERWIRWCLDLVYSWKKQKYPSDIIWKKLEEKKFYHTVIMEDIMIGRKSRFERWILKCKNDNAVVLYLDIVNMLKRLLGRSSL